MTKKIMVSKKVLFDAGEYYIGDPCYVMADENWDETLKQTGCFGYEPFAGYDDEIFDLYGRQCWAFNTLYGDGCYKDGKNKKYYVDSGMLGIVPFDACDQLPDDAQVHFFSDAFYVYAIDGVFYFDNVVIDTN